jgi:hypothetical protein
MSIILIDLIDVSLIRETKAAREYLAGETHDSISGKNLVYMVDGRRPGHHAMVSGCDAQ